MKLLKRDWLVSYHFNNNKVHGWGSSSIVTHNMFSIGNKEILKVREVIAKDITSKGTACDLDHIIIMNVMKMKN